MSKTTIVFFFTSLERGEPITGVLQLVGNTCTSFSAGRLGPAYDLGLVHVSGVLWQWYILEKYVHVESTFCCFGHHMDTYSNETEYKSKKVHSSHFITSKFSGKRQGADFLKIKRKMLLTISIGLRQGGHKVIT